MISTIELSTPKLFTFASIGLPPNDFVEPPRGCGQEPLLQDPPKAREDVEIARDSAVGSDLGQPPSSPMQEHLLPLIYFHGVHSTCCE
jgi:hypothetical protein